jgi:hypothetical protein
LAIEVKAGAILPDNDQSSETRPSTWASAYWDGQCFGTCGMSGCALCVLAIRQPDDNRDSQIHIINALSSIHFGF